MQYFEDRKKLENILLNAEDIKVFNNEVLKLVPELSICVECTQKHPAHNWNVFEHICETVNKVEPNILVKIVALLHDIGKPYKKIVVDDIERFWGHEDVSAELSKFILHRLGYDEEFIEKACILIKYHDYKTKATVEGVQATIDLVGNDLMSYLLQIQTADLLSHSKKYYRLILPHLKDVKMIYKMNFNDLFIV